MIPVSVSGTLLAFQASAQAAQPLSQTPKLQKAALVTQGYALVSLLDASQAPAGAGLDADEPSGYPGAFPGVLRALLTASADQSTLSDMRGFVGAGVFNLANGGT